MRKSLLVLAAALSLSACATAPTAPAPVEQAAWSKDYFKVGARLFPRCQTYVPTGTRVNDSTWCLSDEQIAQIDSAYDQSRVDFQQRSAITPMPQN